MPLLAADYTASMTVRKQSTVATENSAGVGSGVRLSIQRGQQMMSISATCNSMSSGSGSGVEYVPDADATASAVHTALGAITAGEIFA